MNRTTRSVLVASVAVAIALATMGIDGIGSADAKTPFDGKIITSHKRIPTSAKSKRAYFAKLKKQRRNKFEENKEKKQWKIYFAAFFKRPLNDLEVTVKLYDITEKQRRLKNAFEQYLSVRGEKSLISYIKLEREQFGVNRHIEMVIENRGRVLASGRFWIRGEAEKFSGKVDFTEEETKGP